MEEEGRGREGSEWNWRGGDGIEGSGKRDVAIEEDGRGWEESEWEERGGDGRG